MSFRMRSDQNQSSSSRFETDFYHETDELVLHLLKSRWNKTGLKRLLILTTSERDISIKGRAPWARSSPGFIITMIANDEIKFHDFMSTWKRKTLSLTFLMTIVRVLYYSLSDTCREQRNEMIYINIQAYLFEQIVSLRPKIRLEMSKEPSRCIEYTDYLTEV